MCNPQVYIHPPSRVIWGPLLSLHWDFKIFGANFRSTFRLNFSKIRFSKTCLHCIFLSTFPSFSSFPNSLQLAYFELVSESNSTRCSSCMPHKHYVCVYLFKLLLALGFLGGKIGQKRWGKCQKRWKFFLLKIHNINHGFVTD